MYDTHKIGSGSFGKVYEGYHEDDTSKILAIKKTDKANVNP